MSKRKEEYKIEELIKCCGVYPRYHTAGGIKWVQCPKCKNRSATYVSANMNANAGWNEKRRIQLGIEES